MSQWRSKKSKSGKVTRFQIKPTYVYKINSTPNKLNLVSSIQAKKDAEKLYKDFQQSSSQSQKLKLKRAIVSAANKAKSQGNNEIAKIYNNKKSLMIVSTPKIKKVTVIRHEGPTEECNVPRTFSSIEDANKYLNLNRYSVSGNYDKHEFKILFDDGFEYKGRYDLTKDKYADIGDHVINFAKNIEKSAWKPTLEEKRAYKDIRHRIEVDQSKRIKSITEKPLKTYKRRDSENKEYLVTKAQKKVLSQKIKTLNKDIKTNSILLKQNLITHPREPNEYHHKLTDDQTTLLFKIKDDTRLVNQYNNILRNKAYVKGSLALDNTFKGSTWVDSKGKVFYDKPNAELGETYVKS